MAELNAFNNGGDESLGDAVTAIVCTVLGFFVALVVIGVAGRTVGFGAALALSGSVLVGSTVVAVASVRRRPVAAGLACGFALPTLLLLFASSVSVG